MPTRHILSLWICTKKVQFSTHIIKLPPHCACGAHCIGNRGTSKGITHSPSLSSPLLPAAPAFLQRREYSCQIGRPSKLTPKHSETNSTSRPLREREREREIQVLSDSRTPLMIGILVLTENSGVHLHYIKKVTVCETHQLSNSLHIQPHEVPL